MQVVVVKFGTPSQFYRFGKAISFGAAYKLYTKGAKFKIINGRKVNFGGQTYLPLADLTYLPALPLSEWWSLDKTNKVDMSPSSEDPLRKINDTVRKFYLYCSADRNKKSITVSGPGPESDAVVYGSLILNLNDKDYNITTGDKVTVTVPHLILAAAKMAFPEHTSVLSQKDKRSADVLLAKFVTLYQDTSGGASRMDLQKISLPSSRGSFGNVLGTSYYRPDYLIYGDLRLKIEKTLGSGTFGVIQAYANRTNRVALKIMEKTSDLTCFETSTLTNGVDCDCILDQRCLEPTERIVSLTNNEWVVMEPANGDLSDILRILEETSKDKRLPFTGRKIEPHTIVVAKCMVNICKSLIILDNNSKVYLDAKPQNILYTYRPMGIHGMQEIVAKMGDLDGSCQNTSSNSKSSFAKSGVASYPPPDAWADKKFGAVPCKKNYNSWSVAVMLLSFIGAAGLERLQWDVVQNITSKKLAHYKKKALHKCRDYIRQFLLMKDQDKVILKSLYSPAAEDRPSLKVLLDIFTRYRDTLLDYVIRELNQTLRSQDSESFEGKSPDNKPVTIRKRKRPPF